MKALFSFLLLLNIGMFMWGSWHKPVPVGTVGETRPPIKADKMRLLSESTVAAQSSGEKSGKVCLTLGPFGTLVSTGAAGKTLKSLGIDHERRVNITKTIANYRVFLPSLRSRGTAEEKRRQLTRLGFKDHYIIEEPGMENAVSLGVFSVKQNAWALVRRLADKGIKAKQEAVYNTETVYWWDLALEHEKLAQLRGIDWKTSKTKLQDRPCPAGSAGMGGRAVAAHTLTVLIAGVDAPIYTKLRGAPA